MIKFPIGDLLDERECYRFLLTALHPFGMTCPRGHPLQPDLAPHDSARSPILIYKCRKCGAVFHLFTGTVWSGTHYNCVTVALVMRGIAQGTPSLQLAEELGIDYGALLERRHRIQALALENRDSSPLPDKVTEADEMFQNAGEKGERHSEPGDPPRHRADKRRGIGTMANDRPPVAGTVGRESGKARLTVCDDTKQATIQPPLLNAVPPGSVVNTDESSAYKGIGETGRTHAAVCHSAGERARDDDGDGIREVHNNTMEGMWTGLRNFLRPFRGVHKKYLKLYVAIFEWEYNLKRATADFLRALMIPGFTYLPI